MTRMVRTMAHGHHQHHPSHKMRPIGISSSCCCGKTTKSRFGTSFKLRLKYCFQSCSQSLWSSWDALLSQKLYRNRRHFQRSELTKFHTRPNIAGKFFLIWFLGHNDKRIFLKRILKYSRLSWRIIKIILNQIMQCEFESLTMPFDFGIVGRRLGRV